MFYVKLQLIDAGRQPTGKHNIRLISVDVGYMGIAGGGKGCPLPGALKMRDRKMRNG